MDDIITKSNERVAGFFRTLNEMQVKIEKIIAKQEKELMSLCIKFLNTVG